MFKDVRHVGGAPIFNKKPREMPAGDDAAVRQASRALQRPWNARFLQPLGDHLGALHAALRLTVEKGDHVRVRDINTQSDDMNFVVFPERGNFDTVNKPQRQARAFNFLMRGRQARRGVVVGYRERVNAHLNGAVY